MNITFLEHIFLWLVSAKKNYTFLKTKVGFLVYICVNYVGVFSFVIRNIIL